MVRPLPAVSGGTAIGAVTIGQLTGARATPGWMRSLLPARKVWGRALCNKCFELDGSSVDKKLDRPMLMHVGNPVRRGEDMHTLAYLQ